jgi:hypothetical protein
MRYPSYIINICLIQEESCGQDIWYVWGKSEMHTEFWCGKQKPLGRPKRRWRRNIKLDLQEQE